MQRIENLDGLQILLVNGLPMFTYSWEIETGKDDITRFTTSFTQHR